MTDADHAISAWYTLRMTEPVFTYSVVPGTVILLTGDPNELALRMKITGRPNYTPERLRKMEGDLREVYGDENIKIIDTTNLPINDVVRRVAELVHLEPYQPTNIENMLNTAAQ